LSCAAGWEHIYDYLGHILGSTGKYSGIGMHLGHYQAHMNFMTSLGQAQSVQGFFNAKYWVRFITAGAALWMKSLDPQCHTPCCDLNHIGGDGTGIGISLNEVMNVKPIWQPDNLLSKPPIQWGRLDRCMIPSPTTLPDAQRKRIAEAKSFCKQLITEDEGFRMNNQVELGTHKEYIPAPIYNELARWLGLVDENTAESEILKRLLRACVTGESVLGIVPASIVDVLSDILLHVNPDRPGPCAVHIQNDVWKKIYKVSRHGMGDDIADLITCQLECSNSFKLSISTWQLLNHMGGCQLC
jgi:hypothetical protein